LIPLSYTELLAIQDELHKLNRRTGSEEVVAATKKLINWLDEALKRRKAEIERELGGVPQIGDRVIVRNPRGAATFEGETRRGKTGWFEVKSDDGFIRSARPSMCTRVDSPLPIRPSRS
jgi:hypothetical protein